MEVDGGLIIYWANLVENRGDARLFESEVPKSGFYDIDADNNVVKDCPDPIGKVGFSYYDDINALGLGSFEIFPEHRRRGHAEKVLKKLVERFKDACDLIYCFVDADNSSALALYRKIGKVGREPNDKG